MTEASDDKAGTLACDDHGTARLSCQQLSDLLTDYVENLLDPDTRQGLEVHLGHCPPCQAFLVSYREAGHTCREALLSRVPDGLEARLVSFLRQRCRR